MQVAIIGAGPAGLSCALELARKGVAVQIFEVNGAVGGLSKTIHLWDMDVDLGPHRFFSMDNRVTQFWMHQLNDNYVLIDRLTRIFYKNKFFAYPLKPFDAFLQLGPAESTVCAFSYLKAVFSPKGDETTFAQWVSKRFGQRLYEIFFKAYSEKLWGISCDNLDADFAAQRIKGLNLYEAVKDALFRGKTKHKTLIEQFAYPNNGAGEVYEHMADTFTKLGGVVSLNSPVRRIVVKDGRACGVETAKGVFRCDHVVSTMPITDVIEGCDAFTQEVKEAAKQLFYRNTTLVYLSISAQNVFMDNWIYVHAASLKTGRITNFRNWSPAMLHGHNQTVLMLEYWSYDKDPIWNMHDADLIALAKMEIVETGLIRYEQIGYGHVVKIHRSYPVYARGYEKSLAVLQKAIDSISGLTCIGRNGSFKYNNQDHSILMGMLAAENIADNTEHNLWLINTDYDYQEGKSTLTIGKSQVAPAKPGA